MKLQILKETVTISFDYCTPYLLLKATVVLTFSRKWIAYRQAYYLQELHLQYIFRHKTVCLINALRFLNCEWRSNLPVHCKHKNSRWFELPYTHNLSHSVLQYSPHINRTSDFLFQIASSFSRFVQRQTEFFYFETTPQRNIFQRRTWPVFCSFAELRSNIVKSMFFLCLTLVP